MSELPLLTNSRLRTARECARKERLMYQEGWRPVVTGEALRVGTLVHLGLEAYWNCIGWDASEENRSLTYEAASARIDGKAIDAFEQVRIDAMIAAYCARWTATDLQEYEVIGVELPFNAPLVNPETMKPSTTWRLAGKIDAIVRRRSDGRVLVVEHKSCGEDVRDDASDYWTRLQMDAQCSTYVLGAESLGYQVDEILYDVVVKPGQRQKLATPMEARKFKADGTLYANQRAFDESVDEYRVRVREAMDEAPDKWCQRRAIPRSNSQIEEFMYDAWQSAATLRESMRHGRAPRNPDSCLKFGRCPYFSLCSTNSKPEEYPAEFIRVDDVHPELKENA